MDDSPSPQTEPIASMQGTSRSDEHPSSTYRRDLGDIIKRREMERGQDSASIGVQLGSCGQESNDEDGGRDLADGYGAVEVAEIF